MKRIGVVCALALAAGCPKRPAEVIKPKEMTATDAIGAPGGGAIACATSSDDSTLVVDIPEQDRSQIEDLVKNGRVPIVTYDCKTLVVKPTCKLESKFDYAWRDMKERVIEIENKDEASAQLPLASAGLQASLKAGQRIDVAIAVIGSKSTKFEVVARPQLVSLSGNECDDASHFIHKIEVGAFAIAQRTQGEAKAAAQIFASGESSASKSTQQREGKLEACQNAKETDAAPPRDCGVPVRVYMRKIAERKAEVATVEGQPEAKCPEGTVRSDGGTCVAKKADTVYICQHDKLDECKAQCDKGQADSCVSYARALYMGGRGVKSDAPAAIAILEKTCPKQAEPKGCVELADYLVSRVPAPPENATRARAALEYGCKSSDARSCWSLGRYLMDLGSRIGLSDPERGLYYYERGCKLGDTNSCVWAAAVFIEGRKHGNAEVVKKNPAKGLEILDRTCKQNNLAACSTLVRYLTDGRHVKRDPARAATAFELMCAKKSSLGCAEYAILQITGDGVAKNPDVAQETLTKLCYDDNSPNACYGIALLSELGVGGAAKNPDKALEIYLKYPALKDSSARALKLSAGKSLDGRVVADLNQRVCTTVGNTDPVPCAKAGEWYDANDRKAGIFGRADLYYGKACELGDKPSCDKAKEVAAAGPPPPSPPKPIEKKPPPPPKPLVMKKDARVCKSDGECTSGNTCKNGNCEPGNSE